jgi:hypothetical protein
MELAIGIIIIVSIVFVNALFTQDREIANHRAEYDNILDWDPIWD